MAAELMKIAGLNAYAYRGTHNQSPEMATDCYACFANSRKCTDVRQYYGVIVNDVGENVVIGAYRFPNDDDLIELDASAKAELVNSVFSLEPILFGKWRD